MIGTIEAANHLGVSINRIAVLARAGRIVGAEKIGNSWVFPDDLHIIPVKKSHERPGAITAAMRMPEFLARRMPKASGPSEIS